MPTIYGYCRVSTDEQAESGLGLESQMHICKHYITYVLGRAEYQHLERGELFIEQDGVSAAKVDLLKRPMGYELHLALEPGDHIVLAKHDRCFRSVRDFELTRPIWEEEDITLHFADLSVDMTTANGKLVANLLVSVAEWESRVISERTKAGFDVKRSRGEALNGMPPKVGYKHVGKKKILAPNRDQAPMLRLIAWLRDNRGLSWAKISDRIEAILARREGREPIRRIVFKGPSRYWNHSRCQQAYLSFQEIDRGDYEVPLRPWRRAV